MARTTSQLVSDTWQNRPRGTVVHGVSRVEVELVYPSPRGSDRSYACGLSLAARWNSGILDQSFKPHPLLDIIAPPL